MKGGLQGKGMKKKGCHSWTKRVGSGRVGGIVSGEHGAGGDEAESAIVLTESGKVREGVLSGGR